MENYKDNILIGTTNEDKRNKLNWLIEGLGLTPKPLEMSSLDNSLTEDAPNHRGNAENKARFYSQLTDELVISSDGGVIIPALESKWNSLHTHRFAGGNASNQKRVFDLLQLMRPFHGKDRIIIWQEAVAVARSGTLLGLWEAKGREGLLLEDSDRENKNFGFWLHSLWFIPSFNLLYDDLTERQKHWAYDPWSQIKPLIQVFFMNYGAGKFP